MSEALDQLQQQAPNGDRAVAAILSIRLYTGLSALTAVVSVITWGIYTNGLEVNGDIADVLNTGNDVLIVINELLWIVAAVLFIMWSRRGYANLGKLGYPGLTHSDGAMVWWWFVPFGNLYMPYKLNRENYDVTRYLAHKVSGSTDYPTGNAIVSQWWVAYLVMSFVPLITSAVVATSEFSGALMAQSLIIMAATIYAMVRAVRFIRTSQSMMDEVYTGEEVALKAIEELLIAREQSATASETDAATE